MAKHEKKVSAAGAARYSPKKAGGAQCRGSWRMLFYGAFFFFILYIAASFYTNITGKLGKNISAKLLSSAGGASIIILLYIMYIALSRLFLKPVRNMLREFLGTLLIFGLAALLLGLNVLTAETTINIPHWLTPGSFGLYLTVNIIGTLGVLGTLLLGLVVFYLALLLYQIPGVVHAIFLPFALLAQYLSHKKTNAEISDTAQEEAPNISEYDGGDYFGDTMTEFDEPPLTIIVDSEREKGTKASMRKKEIGQTHSALEDDMLRDPTFNIDSEDYDASRNAGVFPPPIEIFGGEESREGEMDEDRALPIGEKIINALEQFGVESRLAEILVGPTVIQFRIQLAAGIKVSKVAALANDIALALAVPSLRIEAPIPGKPYVGIEIPNPKRRGIPLRTVIASNTYEDTDVILPLPFGVAVNGESVVVGLEELPHILVSGTTGSGKSVFVNSCIVGLCSKRTPAELRMILVDPKRVEMSIYDRLPHLLTPPVTDAKKAIHVLGWAVREMESRYTTFARIRVRNVEGYNEKVLPKDRLPYIVIVVDELADLMMTSPKEVEEFICRLAQMARATGIHLMLATQRPSVNVVTGLIKANIPARVAFTLPSNADSRTIIDCAGAEKLLGKGDLLFLSTRHPKPIRIQAPWVAENVLNPWLDYLNSIFGMPDFMDIDLQSGNGAGNGIDNSNFDDDLLGEAIDSIMQSGIASASGLQRRLRIGFSRAGRLIDMMERLGIVGQADGSRPREILVDEGGASDILESLNNDY